MLFSTNLQNKEIYHSEYLDEDIVDLLGRTYTIPDSYQCQIIQVDPGYEGRMDLVSDKLYGDDIYSDIINRLNGPGNPFEVNEDTYMVVPMIDDVTGFVHRPDLTWNEEMRPARRNPQPKARRDKRKPNEAVIGDKRFNIDPQSKVVIY